MHSHLQTQEDLEGGAFKEKKVSLDRQRDSDAQMCCHVGLLTSASLVKNIMEGSVMHSYGVLFHEVVSG